MKIDKSKIPSKTDYNNWTWSYSRVNSFNTCPRQFYYSYVDKQVENETENAFAQYGTFMHELIEKVLLSELTKYEAVKVFKDEFGTRVTAKFPYMKNNNFKQSFWNQGWTYLQFFEMPYESVAVEQKVDFKIGRYNVTGYIDWVCRTPNGKLVILDHKSKGEIGPAEKDEYFRQLYIYSLEAEKLYKEEPVGLVLNLFRKNTLVKEAFDKNKQKQAAEWFKATIGDIKNEKEFKRGLDPGKDFFCKHICSHKWRCLDDGN